MEPLPERGLECGLERGPERHLDTPCDQGTVSQFARRRPDGKWRGKSKAQPSPMELFAITAVRHEWAARSRGPGAVALFEHLARSEPDLALVGATSLAELFGALAGPAKGCPVARWDITNALIRQFHTDELVGLGLLSALVPGLIHVAATMQWGRGGPWGDTESFAGDLVATAWTVLAGLGGSTVTYPERRVLDRVRSQLGHQRAMARQREQRCSSLSASYSPERPSHEWAGGPNRDLEPEDPQPLSVLETLTLALRRFECSQVPREDLRLLFAHRVLGYSLSELAEHGGEKLAALRYRSRQVEALLCRG